MQPQLQQIHTAHLDALTTYTMIHLYSNSAKTIKPYDGTINDCFYIAFILLLYCFYIAFILLLYCFMTYLTYGFYIAFILLYDLFNLC